MAKYNKLKEIVKYYEKNEDVILEKYQSYVYDTLNRECKVSKDDVQPYMSYVLFQYSYDTYFKSYVKKGKGDYPTTELMRWVIKNFNQLEMEYNGTLNYAPIDMLKFILNEYEMSNKLESFINSI